MQLTRTFLALALCAAACTSETGGSGDEPVGGSSENVNTSADGKPDAASNGGTKNGDGGSQTSSQGHDDRPSASDAGDTTPTTSQDAGYTAASDAGSETSADAGTTPVNPGGAVCGSRGTKTCKADEYCSFDPTSQCGAADQGGTCKKRPKICPDSITTEVCGCDGKTYANDCYAERSGASVSHQGACETTGPGGGGPGGGGKTCGGIAGLECPDGFFCDLALGTGCDHIADASGLCAAIPQVCDTLYDPICGCDGKTYSSECVAWTMSASVKSKGACK